MLKAALLNVVLSTAPPLVANVVKPALRRIGTMAASALVTYGLTTDQAVQIESAIMVLGLIAVDFILSALNRKG